MSKICEVIKTLRKERGISQDVVAQHLGVSVQAVSKWECGLCCPDIELIPEIAEFYDVPISYLFGADESVRVSQATKASENDVNSAAAAEAVETLAADSDDNGNRKEGEDVQESDFSFRTDSLMPFYEKPPKPPKAAKPIGFSRVNVESWKLDFPDDGVYRIVQLIGNKVVTAQEYSECATIQLDMEPISQLKLTKLDLRVYGNATIDGAVRGNASAGGELICKDNICGNASAGKCVQCADIEGNASAGENIECAGIDGNATAGGSISCSEIGGNASAGGSISCSEIGGKAFAGCSVIYKHGQHSESKADGTKSHEPHGDNADNACDAGCGGKPGFDGEQLAKSINDLNKSITERVTTILNEKIGKMS